MDSNLFHYLETKGLNYKNDYISQPVLFSARMRNFLGFGSVF